MHPVESAATVAQLPTVNSQTTSTAKRPNVSRRLFESADVATIRTLCAELIQSACNREVSNVRKCDIEELMKDRPDLLSKYTAVKIAEKVRQLITTERRKISS